MLWFKSKYKTVRDELLKSVADNEGMSETPYIDVLVAQNPEHHGIPPDEFAIIKKHFDKLKVTIGIGFTNITKEEALKVTEMRLKALKKQVVTDYPYVKNNDVLDILTELAFQIGLNGLSKFKNMHKAIKAKDYKEARIHGLDSLWNKQTSNRAKRLMDRLAKA